MMRTLARWAAIALMGVVVPVGATEASAGGPPDWLGGEAAIARLQERLPAVAAANGMTAAQLRTTLRGDSTLLVDAHDLLLYVEPVNASALTSATDASVAQSLDAAGTFSLHSHPGSNRVIYLDFDGETITGTAWNNATGGSCFGDPYDSDGSPSTFSQTELDAIASVWARVSEDYARFDIDVTTADPGFAAIDRSDAADLQFGTRALITNSKSACSNGKTLYTSVCSGGCGGVAYVGVFDSAGSNHAFYQPALVFQNGVGAGAKNIAEAAAHEVGHNLGLKHDGTATVGYYEGQGSWAPIMGVGYYRPITQWSRGEYTGANNVEDDFAVMQSHGVSTLGDDFPQSAPTTLTSTTVQGLITDRTDVDAFSLTVTTRSVITVDAAPAAVSPDLDIVLSLTGPNTSVTNDPPSAMSSADVATGLGATITTTVDAGTYVITVDGVGYANPANTGYSDYGSVGAYALSASATATSDPPPPPTITLSGSAYKTRGQPYAALSWNAVSGSTYAVYRNGAGIGTSTKGTYTDGPLAKSIKTASYKVCTTGTSGVCSNTITLAW